MKWIPYNMLEGYPIICNKVLLDIEWKNKEQDYDTIKFPQDLRSYL